MERGLNAVRDSFKAAGKEPHFDVLKPWVIGDSTSLSQADAAARLGMSSGAVKVAVHRLRKRLRERLEAMVRETVDDPSEVEHELRYLIASVS